MSNFSNEFDENSKTMKMIMIAGNTLSTASPRLSNATEDAFSYPLTTPKAGVWKKARPLL